MIANILNELSELANAVICFYLQNFTAIRTNPEIFGIWILRQMVSLDVPQNIPFRVCSVLTLITIVIFNLFVNSLNMQLHFLLIAKILLTHRARMAEKTQII